MARTRRVITDSPYFPITGFAPQGPTGFSSSSSPYRELGGFELYLGGDEPVTHVVIWRDKLVSFGPVTAEQIAFMTAGTPGRSVYDFPGDFVSVGWTGEDITEEMQFEFYTGPFDARASAYTTSAYLFEDAYEVFIVQDPLSSPGGPWGYFYIDPFVVTGGVAGRIDGIEYGEFSEIYLAAAYAVSLPEAGEVVPSAAPSIIFGSDGDDVLGGGGGADEVYGGDGDDFIDGGVGHDFVMGGSGADTLSGGPDPDTFHFLGQSDSVPGALDLILDFQSGSDLITFANVFGITDYAIFERGGFYIISIKALSGDIEIVSRNLVDPSDVYLGQGFEDRFDLTGTDAADVLIGAEGFDSLVGGAGDDLLDGGDGGDLLLGGPGNDIIRGGTGFDGMAGGPGDDIYYSTGDFTGFQPELGPIINDDVFEEEGDGYDTIFTNSYRSILPPNVESLQTVDETGEAVNFMYGNILDNLMIGNAGSNSIFGYDGDDVIRGLGGNDGLHGEGGNDYIEGGDGDDSISGGEGDDILMGGSGKDFMSGGDGNDVLVTGAGKADDSFPDVKARVSGGLGDDVYIVGDLETVVVENADEGTDELRTSALSFQLPENVEILVYTGSASEGVRYRGNGLDNMIAGSSGSDLLDLRDGGADEARGGDGSDGFYLGAALTAADKIDGGEGSDQVGLQGNYALLLGEDTLTGIETLALLSGTDTRFGASGTDLFSYALTTVDANVAAGAVLKVNFNALVAGENVTFDGSAEQDGSFFLFAGKGVDDLTGGAQGDAFYFGPDGAFTTADRVDGGGGTDQVALRGNYSVALTGDELANVETLALLSGKDTRFGAAGPDYGYNLAVADDVVGAGVQFVVNAQTLRAGESVAFDGSAESDGSFRFVGGAGDDSFTGSANADTIFGAGGADTLTGGAGADLFRYRSASESTLGAADTITDFASGSDRIDLSLIDADTGAAGDQAFAFIGEAAFSGAAGELRVVQTAGGWTIEGDVDGDSAADLVIALTSPPPVAGDFVL